MGCNLKGYQIQKIRDLETVTLTMHSLKYSNRRVTNYIKKDRSVQSNHPKGVTK